VPKWAFPFHASGIAVIQVNNLVAGGNSGLAPWQVIGS